jgi:hypothetical protein
MASATQVTTTGVSASDPEEPDDPDPLTAPDEPEGDPDELVTVPDDDAPPEPPLLAAAPSPPPPPSPFVPVDADEPPHAAKRPNDAQSDTPRRLRETTMI